MQRNMRRERQRDSHGENKKPLALVTADTKPEIVPCEVLEPTLLVPRSWTSAFCQEMAKLAMDDKNPVPPHLWKVRAYTIEEFESGRKKKASLRWHACRQRWQRNFCRKADSV